MCVDSLMMIVVWCLLPCCLLFYGHYSVFGVCCLFVVRLLLFVVSC